MTTIDDFRTEKNKSVTITTNNNEKKFKIKSITGNLTDSGYIFDIIIPKTKKSKTEKFQDNLIKTLSKISKSLEPIAERNYKLNKESIILELQDQFDVIKLKNKLNNIIGPDNSIGIAMKWLDIVEILKESELK